MRIAAHRRNGQFDAVNAAIWFAVGTVIALAIAVLLAGAAGGSSALWTMPVVHEPF
jgi:hypothetical protein